MLSTKGDSCATHAPTSAKRLPTHRARASKIRDVTELYDATARLHVSRVLLSHALCTSKILLGGCDFFQRCAAAWLTLQLPVIPSSRDWAWQDKVRSSATVNYLRPNPRPLHSMIDLATEHQHGWHAESSLPRPAAAWSCSATVLLVIMNPLTKSAQLKRASLRIQAESREVHSWLCGVRH